MAKGLWTSFCLNEGPARPAGHEGSRSGRPSRGAAPPLARAAVQPPPDGAAAQLLDWVVDKNGVVELGISRGNDALSVGACIGSDQELSSLRSYRSTENRSSRGRFGRATLPGDAEDARRGDLGAVGRQGRPRVLLGSCTSPRDDARPPSSTSYEVLEAAAAAWKETRGGAPLLLTHLKLYGYAGYNSDPFASPTAVGGWFSQPRESVVLDEASMETGSTCRTFAKLPPQSPPRTPRARYDYHLSDRSSDDAGPRFCGGPERGATSSCSTASSGHRDSAEEPLPRSPTPCDPAAVAQGS